MCLPLGWGGVSASGSRGGVSVFGSTGGYCFWVRGGVSASGYRGMSVSGSGGDCFGVQRVSASRYGGVYASGSREWLPHAPFHPP